MRGTIFMDWKSQYCQSDYDTQGNISIQCDIYQIINEFNLSPTLYNLLLNDK